MQFINYGSAYAFVGSVHILREASALSVLLRRAIPGPQQAERAAGTGSHASPFLYNQPNLERLYGLFNDIMHFT